MTPNVNSLRRPDWSLGGALILAVAVAYWPALFGLRLLDDDLHITAPALQSLSGLIRIWSELGATQQYYPVLHSAFWVEHRLWGDAVVGYHIVNVAQHVLSAFLLVALMRRLQLPGAWIAAFLFALHPVQVESVAWIAEQKNTLSTAFYLGAAFAYVRFSDERRIASYLGATGLFVLAVLSKTSTVTLPPALLVVAWWRHGRLDWRRDVVPLLPWFVIGLAAGLVTLKVEHRLITEIGAALPLTAWQRILLAGRALWFYGATLLWPGSLSFIYERWTVNPDEFWQWLFPVAALSGTAGLVWWARRNRAPLAAWLFFVGTLLPVLGVANVEWFVFSFVADHFVYVASLGVIVPTAVHLSRQSAWLCILPLFGLGVLTWQHSARFKDSATLFEHAARQSPRSAVAHYQHGAALARLPTRTEEAIAALRAALALNPGATEVHALLGGILAEEPARSAEAVPHLRFAARRNPSDAMAQFRLGVTLGRVDGGEPEAQAALAAAIKVNPDFADAHFELAEILARSPDRLSDAIASYERAIRLNPRLFAAHFNLGNALLRLPGRVGNAIPHFENAVRLKPDYAPAHSNLGLALAQVPGRLAEAVPHFEAAVRLDPNFSSARNNLAAVLWAIAAQK
jgi:tetratricopeptide (TPR) repeat protein